MTPKALADLHRRYTEYNDRCKAQGCKFLKFEAPCCKAQGCKFLKFEAPCCKKEVETRKPPRGDHWDTMANCPHCGSLFWQDVTCKGVTAVIPKVD